LSPFTSTVAADIRYSIVTLAPTFRSPVTLVSAERAISHFSLSFCTTMTSSRTAGQQTPRWRAKG
jgi:hypothetical protein